MSSEAILPIIFCVVIGLNVTGNSLAIYIICKKRRTSTDYLLLNLAVADLTFGVFQAILSLSLLSTRLVPNAYKIVFENEVFCRLFTSGNVNWVAYVSSTLTMLMLSVERYFAVCRPHSFKKLLSTRNVKLIVLLSWLLSVLTVIPRNTGKECFILDEEDLSKIISVTAVVFSMFILFVLSTLSVKIYMSLWCKHTLIEPTAVREIEERKKKKKVTLCVLAVVVSYIVFNCPISIWYILFGFQIIQTESRRVSGQIVILLTIVNSALDPYLFSFQNRRMKELLKKIFQCKKEDQASDCTAAGINNPTGSEQPAN